MLFSLLINSHPSGMDRTSHCHDCWPCSFPTIGDSYSWTYRMFQIFISNFNVNNISHASIFFSFYFDTEIYFSFNLNFIFLQVTKRYECTQEDVRNIVEISLEYTPSHVGRSQKNPQGTQEERCQTQPQLNIQKQYILRHNFIKLLYNV